MASNNGPKRARSEVTEDSSSASTVPMQGTPTDASTTTQERDPVLEEQMEQFGVSEDLKASLRSMSPNTRRDVMNDIIRTQRQERLQSTLQFHLFSMLGGASLPILPGDADGRAEGSEDEREGGGRSLSPQRSPVGEAPDRRDPTRVEMRGAPNALLARLLAMMRPGPTSLFFEAIAQDSLGLTQDIDDMSYEQLLELQERIGFVSKGITKQQVEQCTADVPRPKEGSCVVCQGEWEEGDDGEDSVELKVCHHVFHRRCIKEWLGSNKTCPVCKREVI